jgi:hypothetical protein
MKSTATLVAVALILVSPHNRILTIRELRAKPEFNKRIGMLSPPLETVQGDESANQTVERLIDEEIAGREHIIAHPTFFREMMIDLGPGATHVGRVSVYVGHARRCFESRSTDEVQYYGWLTRHQLLAVPNGMRRVEVRPILDVCFGH